MGSNDNIQADIEESKAEHTVGFSIHLSYIVYLIWEKIDHSQQVQKCDSNWHNDGDFVQKHKKY